MAISWEQGNEHSVSKNSGNIFVFRLSDELLASQESFAGRSHLLRKEIKNAMEINS